MSSSGRSCSSSKSEPKSGVQGKDAKGKGLKMQFVVYATRCVEHHESPVVAGAASNYNLGLIKVRIE